MCVFCTKAFARFAGRLHGLTPPPVRDDARPPLAIDEPQPPLSEPTQGEDMRAEVPSGPGVP
jgi:hypothetical protein